MTEIDRELAIGFIGGGNMAQAMVAGLLRSGHPPARIVVAEPLDTARSKIAALHPSLQLTTDNQVPAGCADVLVLAVKPQVMPGVLAAAAGAARPPGQLVVSVAAGIRLDTLVRMLGPAAVRVMPNQPALVGAGMSVLVATDGLGNRHRAAAEYVAAATGRALWIEDETLMDAVTAISGSGPAYFYLLMEIMENTAEQLGLPRETARALVRETALGAARTATQAQADLPALRAAVTSPGGTTAAAIGVMESAGLRAIVHHALVAARDRGAELGRGQS